jgi:hypothetical protein
MFEKRIRNVTTTQMLRLFVAAILAVAAAVVVGAAMGSTGKTTVKALGS